MTNSQKVYAVVGIAAAIGLFYWGWQCHSNRVDKSAGTVVTVKKDSLIFVNVPIPYKVDSLVTVKGKDGKTVIVHDTLETFEVRIDPADTGRILAEFNSTAYYKFTKDTGRAQVTVLDTVRQNRIVGQQIKIVFADTTKTTTVVKTQPKKIVFSFLASAMGNLNEPLYGLGGGMELKFPNEETIKGQVFNIPGHRPMGMITKGWPIRLGKKKK